MEYTFIMFGYSVFTIFISQSRGFLHHKFVSSMSLKNINVSVEDHYSHCHHQHYLNEMF